MGHGGGKENKKKLRINENILRINLKKQLQDPIRIGHANDTTELIKDPS